MKTAKFTLKVLLILLKIFAFIFFIWIGFFLLNIEDNISAILGVVIIILDASITIRYLLIKTKTIYLNFKQKNNEDEKNN